MCYKIQFSYELIFFYKKHKAQSKEEMKLSIVAHIAALCLTVTAHVAQTLFPLIEEAWWLQNREAGILEGDSFAIFSFDYEYMSLYIDKKKVKPIDEDADNETEEIIRLLMRQKHKTEVFLNTYAIPKLAPGEHTLNISLSKKTPNEDKPHPIIIIDVLMKCELVPLLFFRGETCDCHLDQATVRLRHRPKWLTN